MRLVVVAISSVILFFPTFWLFSFAVGPDWGAGIAAVAMYVAFPMLALRIWKGRAVPSAQSMELALRDGNLAEAEYEVSEAAAFIEEEDEGLFYLLSVGPSKTLCLHGQYLYESVERGDFPSSRIRVLWHKRDGFTYGIQCLGAKLEPSRSFSHSENRAASLHEDRQVLHKNLAEVLRSAA